MDGGRAMNKSREIIGGGAWSLASLVTAAEDRQHIPERTLLPSSSSEGALEGAQPVAGLLGASTPDGLPPCTDGNPKRS